ncbi:hypothetical protein LINPERHAP2_LOCUS42260 [Linum perenne]
MYNSEGQVVDGRADTLFCRAAIVAEAKAILTAVEMVRTETDICVIISDCKALVDAIHSPPPRWPWECHSIIAAIREITDAAPAIGIFWQRRELLRDADKIARMAREDSLPTDWLTDLPPFLNL